MQRLRSDPTESRLLRWLAPPTMVVLALLTAPSAGAAGQTKTEPSSAPRIHAVDGGARVAHPSGVAPLNQGWAFSTGPNGSEYETGVTGAGGSSIDGTTLSAGLTAPSGGVDRASL